MSNHSIDAFTDQILAEITDCVKRIPSADLANAVKVIESAPHIFVAGAGRSGLCMRAFGMRLMHLGKTAFVVGETTTPSISQEHLLVLGSGSGKTNGLLSIAKQARRNGAGVLLFTVHSSSPLAGLADYHIDIPAMSLYEASERESGRASIQPLGTLFEQCLWILCDILVLEMKHRSGVKTMEMFERHANLE